MASPEDILAKRIRQTYAQAAREVRQKISAFTAAHEEKSARLLQQVKDGKITEADYKSWLRGQVFIGQRWQEKLKDITQVYVDADEKARQLVGGTMQNVFVNFANETARDIQGDFHNAVSFDMYDKNTVQRLLKDDPDMLPEWKIDEPKDYTWNRQRVQNAVTQGIIQGESVDKISARLTSELAARNANKMNMFARTAITGAQNAGRIDRLHEAQQMGIKVKKKWLAALDDRTRDTHRDLNGVEVDVDEPFTVKDDKGIEYEIDYPGDPHADPAMVYNCRCTLIYVYPDYEQSLEQVQEAAEEAKEEEPQDEPPEEVQEEPPETPAAEEEELQPDELYTQDEKDAIEWYVSGVGQWINQYLRNPDDFGELSDNENELLELMTAATERQTVQDEVLYRAVDAQAVFGRMSDMDFENLRSAVVYGDTSRQAQSMLERAESKIGEVVTEDGFMSTTRDPEVAYYWDGYTGSTKDITLELTVPEGIHGFDVENMFEVDEEQQREVLLERGLSYKITNVEKRETDDGTVIVVQAEILEPYAKKKGRR